MRSLTRLTPARVALAAVALAVTGGVLAPFGGAPSASAADLHYCTSADVFSVYGDGAASALEWYRSTSPASGANFDTQDHVFTGFEAFSSQNMRLVTLDAAPGQYAHLLGVVASGPRTGTLMQYTYDLANPNHMQTGAPAGTGFDQLTQLTAAGNGVLYGVHRNGALLKFTWDARHKRYVNAGQIGHGWGGFQRIVAGGEGVIYAVDADGYLVWYRNTSEAGVPGGTWLEPKRVGYGWDNFASITSSGGGVLWTLDAHSQKVTRWDHTGFLDGGAGFTSQELSGVYAGHRTLAANPMACYGAGTALDPAPAPDGGADTCGYSMDGASHTARTMVATACAQRSLTYAWGGGHAAKPGPSQGQCDASNGAPHDCEVVGLDCSGLVRYAYSVATGDDGLNGNVDGQYRLSRRRGKLVDTSAIQPGDILFYGVVGNMHHVGIYLGQGQMINAYQSGKPILVSSVQSDLVAAARY